jgi:hypothetical protein
MKSETIPAQQVFQDRRQYLVPFYQRAYVWTKEDQWEPLWNDVADKAEARVKGDTPTPHFLGAIVPEPQTRRGLRGVETYRIIDGQQRPTTLQYLLAAVAMTARADGQSGLSPLIEGCVWNANPETMENPAIERFKVWPTFRDRVLYRTAMECRTRENLRASFRPNFTQSETLRRVCVEHPPALEAIWYFREQIDAWLADGADRCLEQVAETVMRNLWFVSISLDADDDAQVIFETLNGRGAELQATDLGERRPNDLASPRTRRRHRPPAGESRPGPGCVKSAGGCDAASTGLFLDPSRAKIAGICFVTLAQAARRLSAVGSLVLTAPAQGVIMAASALTPTSAIRASLAGEHVDRHLGRHVTLASHQEVRCANLPYENCSLTSRSTGWSNG